MSDGAADVTGGLQTNDSSSSLPINTKPYTLQTGGHAYTQGKNKAGILLHEDNSVLKHLMPPPRGLRELEFYETVFDSKCQDPILLNIRVFIPAFLGVFHTVSSEQTMSFLKLENLTYKFKKPSIMDVKIGFKTHDPEASLEKIKRTQGKYLTTSRLGFCIPGMKIYDELSGKYMVCDKNYGKALTERNVKDALIQFLGNRERIIPKILEDFLHQLNRIKKWFLMQKQFSFYSSSLLFIYESASEYYKSLSECVDVPDSGQTKENSNNFQVSSAVLEDISGKCGDLSDSPNMGNDTLDSCQVPNVEENLGMCITRRNNGHAVAIATGSGRGAQQSHSRATSAEETVQLSKRLLTDIRMIDFAHVFPTQTVDMNYLGGLNNLIKFFDELVDEFS